MVNLPANDNNQEEPTYVGMAAVLARFGPPYLAEFGDRMPPEQLRALRAIQSCRTPAAGGHVLFCQECGVFGFNYHSCGDRACPKCSHHANDEWLRARASELLPVPYHHIVLTVPEQLRRPIRKHQRALYGVLMQAAAKAVRRFAKERFGVDVGLMTVLHTWSRKITYHPHVHCVVTGGGLTDDGRWKPIQADWPALRRLLARRFRDLLLSMAKREVQGLQYPRSVDTMQWVAFVDEARGNTEQLIGYLARYVNRTALSDRRIEAIRGDHVRIRFTPSGTKESKAMWLTGREFLRRFLQHVLPKGFHRVRYYGFWAPTNRDRLRALQLELGKKAAAPPATDQEPLLEPPQWLKCPDCGAPTRTVLGLFKAGLDPNHYDIDDEHPGRAPPELRAA